MSLPSKRICTLEIGMEDNNCNVNGFSLGALPGDKRKVSSTSPTFLTQSPLENWQSEGSRLLLSVTCFASSLQAVRLKLNNAINK